jgi:hypothetical protein
MFLLWKIISRMMKRTAVYVVEFGSRMGSPWKVTEKCATP